MCPPHRSTHDQVSFCCYQAPDGEWHMYTMSYDGTHVFYYLDNVFAYNVSMTGK